MGAEVLADFALGAVVADVGPVFSALGCVVPVVDVGAGVGRPVSLPSPAPVVEVELCGRLTGTFGVLGFGPATFTVGTAVGLVE